MKLTARRESVRRWREGGDRAGGDESPSLQMLVQRSSERPTERDWADVRGALPLLSRLGKRHMRGIAKLAQVVDYSPGEIIVQANTPGDSFYLVLEGRANLAGRSRSLRPGDSFGEMALIDGGRRPATVTAASDVRTMKFPRRAFLEAVEEDPSIGFAIMEALTTRIRRLERAASA